MELHRRRILIVDDERIIRELLHRILEAEGFSPIVAQDGTTALEMIRVGLPDLVISDIKMAGMDGLELLRVVKHAYSELPVILMTAWGGVDGAVQALKEGAYDYLTKPIVPEKLVSAVRSAFGEHPSRLLERAEGTALPVPAIQKLRELMGPSTVVKTIIDDVALVSPSDFSVVILGETGTGKELIARAIHGAGLRRAAPLVAVDCGAIPETLFESELFGYEKGAFTGATGRKLGKFEIAEKGTLFLDEIANLPLGSQTKLLRAIQEKSFFRVGATVPTQVNVRFIVATNANLVDAVRKGIFSTDLFYRLSEFTIKVPPLRERKDDVVFLARRFVKRTNEHLGKHVSGFSAQAEELLKTYPWPGNVRQLRSTVRRAVLRASDVIEPEHFGLDDLQGLLPEDDAGHPCLSWTEGMSLKEVVTLNIREIERQAIIDALAHSGGNKAKAARLLQIDYTTLHAKIRLYRIQQ